MGKLTYEQLGHVLFQNGDSDAPEQVKDRNGEVVLGQCRLCGRAEIELEMPCPKARRDPNLEAEIHKLIRKYVNKRKQGYMMGDVRAMLKSLPAVESKPWKELASGLLELCERSPVSSGVCMCGDSIEGHTHNSGHKPVDAFIYAVEQYRKEYDQLSTTEPKALLVTDVLKVARHYMSINPSGGTLHDVLWLKNVRSRDLGRCLKASYITGDTEGVELALMLCQLTRAQRAELVQSIAR